MAGIGICLVGGGIVALSLECVGAALTLFGLAALALWGA